MDRKHTFQPTTPIADDERFTEEIREHSEKKYGLFKHYAGMFSTSMKDRWYRVYVDLFAGAGHGRIEGRKDIYLGSPLLALTVKYPFNKYVFCEKDARKLEALRLRVEVQKPASSEIAVISGDANAKIDEVMKAIPERANGRGALAFCFVDPYALQQVHFSTLRALSGRSIDLLMLIPSYMDAHRNAVPLQEPDNRIIEQYLGDPGWREEWIRESKRGIPFGVFVVNAMCHRMSQLRHSITGKTFETVMLDELVQVNITKNDAPLYHLAFFSRNKLGIDFWRKTIKANRPKGELSLFPEM